MIEQLNDQIWDRQQFHSEFDRVVLASLHKTIIQRVKGLRFSVAGEKTDRLSEDEFQRLVQTATHFAASNRVGFREAAYRIAVSTWMLLRDAEDDYNNLRGFAHFIFRRLGNFPADDYLFSDQDDVVRGNSLPLMAWLSIQAHEDSNRIRVADGIELTLTDFQRDLWHLLEARRSAAISAPTSAGKSFALEHFLTTRLNVANGRYAAYIVPTRALINQVSSDLLDTAVRLQNSSVPISTIPVPPAESGMDGGIYVLTPERLQVLLDADKNIVFELVVVDEAQSIAEPARGVILQTVIEEVIRRSRQTQLLFAAPSLRDPSVFASLFGVEIDALPRPERPVAQNLLFLDTNSALRNRVEVGVLIKSGREELGSLVFQNNFGNEEQTLAALSYFIGSEDKNLIYASTKSACERVSNLLRQFILADRNQEIGGLFADVQVISNHINDEVEQERQLLANFIEEHVHPEYQLAQTVRDGIAFHYGNMPSLVRKSIEDYFGAGKLSFLVCTSTLLHGVNLPAKNLFLSKPSKGKDKATKKEIPISANEFWNLAGRAGRLGKEFEGNVFMINYKSWENEVLTANQEQEVMSAVEQTLRERKQDFMSFVANRQHASGSDDALENIFVKLVNSARAGRLSTELERLLPDLRPDREEIEQVINDTVSAITVPAPITERNITVSVLRQQQMFDYFRRGIRKNGPKQYIPSHPAASWEEVNGSMISCFRRIHKEFEMVQQKDESHKFFGPLAARWMRGEPLPRIIQDAIDYRRKKSPKSKSATIIRETLDSIEKDLRFRYVKYMSCYQDLLAEALTITGFGEFVKSIPSIALYLELGAHSTTMISLIGLGLSRTTAGLLSQIAYSPDMDREVARRWLMTQQIDNLELPVICVQEIRGLLAVT